MSKRTKEEKIDSVIVKDASMSNQNRRNRKFWIGGATALLLMIGVGAFAKNGWFPNTDAMTGKKTGWFGRELPKNASSSWNPFAAPLPSVTPQLSKEYVYAGSRLLAVEDVNANVAPPTDLAVWRPVTGTWFVLGGVPGSASTTFGWGLSTDKPVPGDFDGDGKTDFSVFRPTTGEWYVINSSTGYWSVWQWGLESDIRVPADYDGDGKTDRAIWRPTTGMWYIVRSSDEVSIYLTFGSPGDIPAPADYDGDGKADIAVWRNSSTTFYSKNSSDSVVQTVGMGTGGTQPVSADYDGDGKANYAVRNGATWHIANTARSVITPTTPSNDQSSDIPVQNDYDGDGKVDIAVWRDSNGNWYIRKSGSSNALRQEAWGISGDIPVAAYYRR
ncbi:MAG TPA: VCBS repeat-containing protein [Pyrinomonadaceae bacterium]|jgi:uncharacterized cupin superfamily protein|nr:VCBS repeat-containing protein [Chloracidobacterium sp.]MBP9936498.1 VCBS repeat-containing protein [Pyrinomonadaceae bacterium]MBK7802117.1 VCBS repeat-containing protein [Chloracidobacterium sp.]MBK9437735.1 VCBS repeat-containing protein [Chloracidobacterium sp.]MBK9765864.1 VCBS repeat-containing protein [Chloracidobacterium sp.]